MSDSASINLSAIGLIPTQSGERLLNQEQVEKILAYRISPSTKHLQRIAAFESNSDGKVTSLAAAVGSDPFVAARLISIMNSASFSRTKAIVTSEEAIKLLGINKFRSFIQDAKGSKPLEGMLTGRATAVGAFQELLLAASCARILHQKVFPAEYRTEFLEIVTALLGFPLFALSLTRPDLYSTLIMDGVSKKDIGNERGIKELYGMPRQQAASMAAKSLGLPEDFSVVLSFSHIENIKSSSAARGKTLEVKNAATIAVVANAVARAYLDGRSLEAIDIVLKDAGQKNAQLSKILPQILKDSYAVYAQRSEMLGIGVNIIPAPETFLPLEEGAPGVALSSPTNNDRLNLCIAELRASLRALDKQHDNFRLTHCVYVTLLALSQAFDFERAMLFLTDPSQRALFPSFLLGSMHEKFRSEMFFLEKEEYSGSALVIAAKKKRAVFQGDPVYGGKKVLVAFPLLRGGQVLGVFYAERDEARGTRTMAEEMRCMALSELWQGPEAAK